MMYSGAADSKQKLSNVVGAVGLGGPSTPQWTPNKWSGTLANKQQPLTLWLNRATNFVGHNKINLRRAKKAGQ